VAQRSERGFHSFESKLPFPTPLAMDCVTMKLVERATMIPLDLLVLINSFLSDKLTDENFHDSIALWFTNEEECKWRFGHLCNWNTSRITNMSLAFFDRENFNEDISSWDVSNVTNMSSMFRGAIDFNGDLNQ
jgi:surface protein